MYASNLGLMLCSHQTQNRASSRHVTRVSLAAVSEERQTKKNTTQEYSRFWVKI